LIIIVPREASWSAAALCRFLQRTQAEGCEIFWQRTEYAAPTGLGNFWFGFLQRGRAYGADGQRYEVATNKRMIHNLCMAEKIVVLLGDIAHEGVTSALLTSGIAYKVKFLTSSVENWESIIRIFKTHEVKMVLGKLTGDVYARFVSQDYADVGSRLLKEITARPHRLFAYEALLANKISDETEEFSRPPVEVMQKANKLFTANSLDILPYRKRAEVTVSAQSFVKETDEGLLFRLYVPSGRLWGDQLGQLLSLFKDYLSKVAGLNVRLDQQSTSKGVIYAFHGTDLGEEDNDRQKLTKHFEDFTKLTDLCATDPSAAEEILKGTGANAREITQIISRYSKEFRRLQLDLKHAREEKILSIRHRLESELVDVVQPAQQGLIESTVNALIPEVVGNRVSQAMLLPFTKSNVSGQPNITLNFKPQFIEHIEGVVAQEVNGIAQLNNNDKALISLFEQHGGSKATELTSALQELNDDSAPEPGRVTAKQRIKQFLISAADKIGDAAAGVLQTYVEKKLLGL
jgi:hypothetical protein